MSNCKNMFIKLLSLCVLLSAVHCYIVDPGPVVKATRGGVWPKPKVWTPNLDFLSLDPEDFEFKIVGNTCSLVKDAIDRYVTIITSSNKLERRGRLAELNNLIKSKASADQLNELNINLKSQCEGNEKPTLFMDESYQLTISDNTRELSSNSVWGIIRGLETFSQLIHLAEDNYNIIVNHTHIEDQPRFPFRGLLLDTSRHFLPLYILLQTLDAMAYNKLNVLHWHIVDDHSFPYQSKSFPELSEMGAYHPVSKIYTQVDVALVIEHARLRGIRVLAEFDTPGHTRSWGEGVKGILTECYENGQPTGQYGPMDPSKDDLYTFIDKFFKEIISVFPDQYLHLGGDEVEFECWQSNKDINAFMEKLNITGDYKALESYYIQKLFDIVKKHGAYPIVWEEVFVNGVEVGQNTCVHVWKDDGYTVLNQVTKAGKAALLSSCWYLDHLSTGGDWQKFYNCDPHNINGTAEQLRLILGGEACMWAESVNEYNIGSRIWPRASAAAEKLWSPKDADTYSEAAKRLEEHTCRMNHRGVPAQPPNGPGVCL